MKSRQESEDEISPIGKYLRGPRGQQGKAKMRRRAMEVIGRVEKLNPEYFNISYWYDRETGRIPHLCGLLVSFDIALDSRSGASSFESGGARFRHVISLGKEFTHICSGQLSLSSFGGRYIEYRFGRG